ncbi:MAG: hypothetical protein RLY20_2731 [Verrucomicrobiota bacterium]|jgi:hypothetical protein
MQTALKQTFTSSAGVLVFCLMGVAFAAHAANPIVPNRGLNDPHIHIFGDRAYVYASHDRAATNQTFIMDDWWVWSSPDLVHWTNECVIKPEQTYIGKPFTGCWATDAAYRNGKYYFYFSERNKQAGVLVGDSPAGPWRDPLGKPLLTADLTPTHEYDSCVFQDDDGQPYIIFGVWDYYIARLNDDMISLAEKPRLLELDRKSGPYGQGKTDDKPNLHRANGRYYLTWGCFYAMADNVYGPYTFKGAVINTNTSFAPGYASPTWPNGPLQGRHGNYFTWHGQWYYTYCDISQTGNRYFRDAFISYVHYRANGEIAPIRVDGVGVGEYRASDRIEAENFFTATDIVKQEIPGGFAVSTTQAGGHLAFPNVRGVKLCSSISLRAASGSVGGRIEVRENSPQGRLLARCQVTVTDGANQFRDFTCRFQSKAQSESLCFVFHASGTNAVSLDAFTLVE